jgi:hypothetical protein
MTEVEERFRLPQGQWVQEGQFLTSLGVWWNVLRNPVLIWGEEYHQFLLASLESDALRDMVLYMALDGPERAASAARGTRSYIETDEGRVLLPEGVEPDMDELLDGLDLEFDGDRFLSVMSGRHSHKPRAWALMRLVGDLLPQLSRPGTDPHVAANIRGMEGFALWHLGGPGLSALDLGLEWEADNDLCLLTKEIIELNGEPLWKRAARWKEEHVS